MIRASLNLSARVAKSSIYNCEYCWQRELLNINKHKALSVRYLVHKFIIPIKTLCHTSDMNIAAVHKDVQL